MVANPYVVVVEDDQDIREQMLLFLQLAGVTAIGAADGKALDRLLAEQEVVDLVVLDVGLPGESGFEIAARLHRSALPIGIIMLTARGELDDRVHGLSAGADAYLVKPVNPRELVATLLAVRRRIGGAAIIWALSDDAWHLILPGGRRFALSRLQRQLLLSLVRHPLGIPVHRDVLMEELGYDTSSAETHRLETLVNRFRQKLKAELDEDLPIRAVPGQGYMLAHEIAYQGAKPRGWH